MKLYLDNVRNPGEEGMIEHGEEDSWIIVRTVKEFK